MGSDSQDKTRKEEQHIIVEDEEGQRCRHWQQREGARVGDHNGDDNNNGDSEGSEGVQTVSNKNILFYDQLNRFLISVRGPLIRDSGARSKAPERPYSRSNITM